MIIVSFRALIIISVPPHTHTFHGQFILFNYQTATFLLWAVRPQCNTTEPPCCPALIFLEIHSILSIRLFLILISNEVMCDVWTDLGAVWYMLISGFKGLFDEVAFSDPEHWLKPRSYMSYSIYKAYCWLSQCKYNITRYIVVTIHNHVLKCALVAVLRKLITKDWVSMPFSLVKLS